MIITVSEQLRHIDLYIQIKTIGKSHAFIISFQLSFLLHKLKRLTRETNKDRNENEKNADHFKPFRIRLYGQNVKLPNIPALFAGLFPFSFRFLFFISCLDTVTHSLSNSRNRNAKADEKFIVFWPRQKDKRTYKMRSFVYGTNENIILDLKQSQY